MALVISSLLFLPSIEAYAVEEIPNRVESSWIYDEVLDNEPFEGNEVAGSTEGYGRFILGADNVKLNSTANSGFSLVGWQIASLEADVSNSTFIDAYGLDENGSKNVTVSSTNLTLQFLDTDLDGYYDSANLVIERVAEHLQINAIFNYIYYDADITDVVTSTGVLDRDNYMVQSLGVMDRLYYTGNDGLTYHDVIIYRGDKDAYYYYGEAIFDGDNVYTQHLRMDSEEVGVNVDYLRGAFTLNTPMDINVNVNISDDEINSVDLDVLGFGLSCDGESFDSGVNFNKTQDEFKRTSSFNMSFDLLDCKSKINVIKLQYAKLYRANLDLYTDDTPMQETFYNNLIGRIQVDNAFSTISKQEGKYFVKDASDNGGIGLRVTVPQKINDNIDGVTYDYYNLDTLNGVKTTTYSFGNNEITESINIEIKYVSISYIISFEARIYDSTNGTISRVDDELNLENSILLNRGESRLIEKSNASNNTGYSFYGFALNNYTVDKNTSITVNIDENKPKNQTILMLFEKINYRVVVKNYDVIDLTNDENTIYAIDKLLLTLNRGGVESSELANSQDLRNASGEYTFINQFVINDELTLLPNINNGFKINGYCFSLEDFISELDGSINFKLDADFLAQYATSTDTIELYFEEDFTHYIFTYYIEANNDTPNGDYKIMADLSLEYNGETVNINDAIESGFAEIVKEDDKHSIVLSNLKLYDKVLLKANGIADSYLDSEGQVVNFKYVFNRLTENNKTNFTPDYYDADYVEYTTTILKDDSSVKVVYSRPDARLIITLNNELAYDISKLNVYENDERLDIDSSSGTVDVRITAGANIRVALNSTGESIDSLFNFGYVFTNYTLETNNTTTSTPPDASSLEYIFTAGGSIQRLTINFREKNYLLVVDQYKDTGEHIGYVSFGGSDNLSLTVSSRSIDFTMPNGYYASGTYFVNAGIESAYDIAQDNSYISSQFSYTFSEDEFISVVRRHGVTTGGDVVLNMKVVYTLHTYTIEINFGLTNPKNYSYDSQIVYPTMVCEYTFGSGDLQTARRIINSTVTKFVDIPYDAKNVVINVSGEILKGLSVYGWAVNEFNDAPNSSLYPNSTSTTLNFRDPIRENIKLYYKLTYDSYEIRVVSNDSLHGNPSVYVNGKHNVDQPSINSISLFDELLIEMNPTNVYRFSRMTYQKDGVEQVYSCYEPYVYLDDEQWNTDYITLYVYSETEGYTRNISKEYDANLKYFTANVRSFRDGQFNVANYDVVNGVITFYVDYVDKEIIIFNNNLNYNSNTLQIGDLDIAPSEYSSVKMKVTHKDGTITQIPQTNLISTDDKSVDITIEMQDVIVEGETYNLSLGVRLVQIFMQSNLIQFSMLDDKTYKFSFNVNDVIDYLPDSGLLTINYQYLVTNRQVTITTNVDDPTFYSSGDTPRFEMSYNNLEYGFGNTLMGSSGKSALSNELRFLGKSLYKYTNAHSQYFEVYDIRVYLPRVDTEGFNILDEYGNLIAGEEIPFSQFKYYGVTFKNFGAVDFDLKEALAKGFDVRFVTDLVIKLQIEPIIYYNYDKLEDDAYVFISTFAHDREGNGLNQKLSVGPSNSSQIRMDAFIYDFLGEEGVKYYDINDITNVAVTPTNVGRYRVELNFGEKSQYSWLKDLELTYNIYFDILPKEISLTYNINDRTFSKVYDGNSYYNANLLLQYLVFTDGGELAVKYTGNDRFELNTDNISCNITYTGAEDVQIPTAVANDETFRNLSIRGIALSNNKFNNNFILSSDSVLMMNVFKISRKAVTISGVSVYDKVFDSKDTAEIDLDAQINIKGLIEGDDVSIDKEKISVKFEDITIGKDRRVTISAQDALLGEDSENYALNVSNTYATIYPYKISTTVEGLGVITLYNDRGLTDKSKAGLIPLDAELKVEVIKANSSEYADIYSFISKFLDNNNVMAVGYKISFVEGISSSSVSNELYISVPNVNKLTNSLWLTDEESGELYYTESDGYVKIDLSQIVAGVDTIILLQQRILLQLWQIILIIVCVAVVIAIVIIIFVVVRKKKERSYGKYDKI